MMYKIKGKPYVFIPVFLLIYLSALWGVPNILEFLVPNWLTYCTMLTLTIPYLFFMSNSR